MFFLDLSFALIPVEVSADTSTLQCPIHKPPGPFFCFVSRGYVARMLARVGQPNSWWALTREAPACLHHWAPQRAPYARGTHETLPSRTAAVILSPTLFTALKCADEPRASAITLVLPTHFAHGMFQMRDHSQITTNCCCVFQNFHV